MAREEIQRRYPDQLAACEALRALAEAHRPSGRPTPDDAGPVILDTFNRSTKTYAASVLLASEGFGEQAGMLNRALFEDMIVAHWIKNHPASVEKMRRHSRWVFEQRRGDAHRYERKDILAVFPPMSRVPSY